MTTTSTPSRGNAFHHPNVATSHGDAPHPEWMPLDEIAHIKGIEHSIADLDEACQQWQSVLLWLDALARETRQHGAMPSSVEKLTSLVLEQQQRVLSLLLRVQQEYLNAHREPLLISLGHLPSTPEKGRLR